MTLDQLEKSLKVWHLHHTTGEPDWTEAYGHVQVLAEAAKELLSIRRNMPEKNKAALTMVELLLRSMDIAREGHAAGMNYKGIELTANQASRDVLITIRAALQTAERHDVVCNADHSLPIGTPGCSCLGRRDREIEHLQKVICDLADFNQEWARQEHAAEIAASRAALADKGEG